MTQELDAPWATLRETPDIETASDGYATRFSGPVGAYFLSVQAAMTLKLLGRSEVKTVLEVGGGHGQLVAPLLGAGYAVTVTGSAPACRARLVGQMGPGGARFLTSDLFHLPLRDRSFDAVMAFRLLPHLDQWQRLLGEMCRVADRAVVFDYPDIRSFNAFYRLAFGLKHAMEKNTRTFRLFHRRSVARELQRHGFDRVTFHPQFFMPMVVHRVVRSRMLATTVEAVARTVGLTRWLGSPIIVCGRRPVPETA